MKTLTVKALATASVVLLLSCDFAMALASGGGPGGVNNVPLDQRNGPEFQSTNNPWNRDCRGRRHRYWRHNRWYC